MCYTPDLKTDFYWRSVEDEKDYPAWDHTFLVSDGNVIGLAGYSLENGEGQWYTLWTETIDTVTYYGAHCSYPESKQSIKIEDIKYWAPIPSLNLQGLPTKANKGE